jgi:hypothetical protein
LSKANEDGDERSFHSWAGQLSANAARNLDRYFAGVTRHRCSASDHHPEVAEDSERHVSGYSQSPGSRTVWRKVTVTRSEEVAGSTVCPTRSWPTYGKTWRTPGRPIGPRAEVVPTS